MPKPLAITARQVTAICKGAAKGKCIAEIKIGDVIVRLIPNDMFTEPETATGLPENSAKEGRPRLSRPISTKADFVTRLDRNVSEVNAERLWREALIRSELGRFELDALDVLAVHADQRLPLGGVRGLGAATRERLLIRGFIEVDNEVKPTEVWITKAGLKFYKAPNPWEGSL